MRARITTIAAGLVVVVGVLWFLFGRPQEYWLEPMRSARDATRATEPLATSDGSDVPEPAIVAQRSLDAGEVAGREGELAIPAALVDGEFELAPPPLDPVEVEVRDSAGEPLPDTTVAWIPDGATTQDDLPRTLAVVAQFRKEGGRVYRTDELGVARVERPRTRAFVFAQHGSERAATSVGILDFDPVVLKLRSARRVDVEVRDSEGRPCRAEVAAAATTASLLSSDVHATADGEGHARLDDLDLRVARAPDAKSVVVGLRCVLDEPVAVDVPLDDPNGAGGSTAPVVLTTPATGELDLQLCDDEQQPLELSASVTLRVGGSKRRTSRRLELDGHGRARAEVGLGLAFEYDVDVSERGRAHGKFAGPTSDAPTLAVNLVANHVGPLLCGRAVDPDGAPLVATALEGVLECRRSDGSTIWSVRRALTTDGDGRFRHDQSTVDRNGVPFVREEGAQGPPTVRFALHTADGADVPSDSERVVVDLPTSGLVELGDVKLTPRPLLAAGRVVDERGAPVAAASVRVDELDVEPKSWLTARTGDDGTFQTFGTTAATELALTARFSGLLGSRRETCRVGAKDVVLTLRDGGALRGSLRVDERLPLSLFRVAVEPEFGDAAGQRSYVRVDGEGAFGWSLLEPGDWRLTLLLKQGNRTSEVTTVRGLSVEPRRTCRDARVQELDVASRLNLVQLEAHAPDGSFVGDGSIVLDAGDGDHELVVPFHEGKAWFPTTRRDVTLVVTSPGFRYARLENVNGFVSATLERAVDVELDASERPGPAGPLVPWSVSVEPAKRSAPPSVLPAVAALFRQRAARLTLQTPGRHVARVVFAPAGTPPGTKRKALRGAVEVKFEFDVADERGLQRIELE